jgi:hypothetical protein
MPDHLDERSSIRRDGMRRSSEPARVGLRTLQSAASSNSNAVVLRLGEYRKKIRQL